MEIPIKFKFERRHVFLRYFIGDKTLRMVYVLRNVQNGETLTLGPNRTYNLGRSRRNSIHLKDITVDKMHATLVLTDSSAQIEDKGSEYGTWVNKRKIDEPFILQNSDVIVFGKKNCKYVFLVPNFKVVIDKSVLRPTKSTLTDTLNELNINLMDSHTRGCSHYVIESITLDVLKEQTILYNLIERKTVITPKYFTYILENIEDAPLMPNIYKYMPDIDDSFKSKGIEDINPRKNRRYIFDNMMFIFFNGNCFEDLNDLIIKCGGDTILYRQSTNFISDLFRDSNRYKYIAVNHLPVGRKSPLYYCFLRTIKKKKKNVSNIFVDDIYISIFKGDLVGVDEETLNEKDTAEDPQPSTSRAENSDKTISSSDDDIRCAIVKSTVSNANKELRPLDTFSGLAMAYKERENIRETFMQNLLKSPTLNRVKKKGQNSHEKDVGRKTDRNKHKNRIRKRLIVLSTDDELEEDVSSPTKNRRGKTRQNKRSSNNNLTDDDSISTNESIPPKKLKINSKPNGSRVQSPIKASRGKSNLTDDDDSISTNESIPPKKLKINSKPNGRVQSPIKASHGKSNLTDDDSISTNESIPPKKLKINSKPNGSRVQPPIYDGHGKTDLNDDDSTSTNQSTPPKKIKTRSNLWHAEAKKVANCTTGLGGSKNNHQPVEERKGMVVNPFAIENSINRPKEGQNGQQEVDDWQKRFKNVEIIPMT